MPTINTRAIANEYGHNKAWPHCYKYLEVILHALWKKIPEHIRAPKVENIWVIVLYVCPVLIFDLPVRGSII